MKFEDLTQSIEWSQSQLKTARENRLEFIRAFTGKHYAEDGAELVQPTNFIELGVTTYIQAIAARSPHVIVTTDVDKLRPFAFEAKLALDQATKELNLRKKLQRTVLEALFAMGVLKVGISVNEDEEGKPQTQIFCDPLSVDDYFFDVTAKTEDAIQYEGNDYWLTVSDIKEVFGADIFPDAHNTITDDGQKRAESITTSPSGREYKERVHVRDVYIHTTNELITYAVSSKRILKQGKFDGPDGGPYHRLFFNDVPGNILPLPTVALWYDMHEVGNKVFRKVANQAVGSKNVLGFTASNEDSIARLKGARDGDGITFTGAPPVELKVGGVNPATLAFFVETKNLFSYFAGNLDALGGLSRMSDTVGQDKMMAESASARISHLADRTVDFIRGVYRAIAWYEWTDPVRVRHIVKRPHSGSKLGIPIEWSFDTRNGDFLDYNFDIDVHSMQDDSPMAKLQKIGDVLERFVLPYGEQIAAMGGQINIPKLMQTIGTLANLPEVEGLIVWGDAQSEETPVHGDASPEPSFKTTVTKRIYERRGRSGQTREGHDRQTVNQLLDLAKSN